MPLSGRSAAGRLHAQGFWGLVMKHLKIKKVIAPIHLQEKNDNSVLASMQYTEMAAALFYSKVQKSLQRTASCEGGSLTCHSCCIRRPTNQEIKPSGGRADSWSESLRNAWAQWTQILLADRAAFLLCDCKKQRRSRLMKRQLHYLPPPKAP